MARLPARSNSCITCKKRKVKCDEAKPSCKRCKKAYMNCEGYRKSSSMIWVNENSRFGQSEETESVSVIGVSSSSNSTSLVMANFYPTDFTRMVETTYPTMDISTKSEDLWICYLSTKLLPGKNYANIASHIQGKSMNKSWVLDLLDWDCESVAYYTVCCLSSAFWARMHNAVQTISKVSGSYYVKALRQLCKNINNESTRHNPTNVACAFLLGIFELTMFEHGHGWLQHAGGVSSLILMRGPEAHTTEPARFYYQISRLPIISQSLFLRKRTFLEEPEWQTVSATIESPKTGSIYRLTDMMAKIPGLLEDSDILRRSVPGCQSPFCRSAQLSYIEMDFRAKSALNFIAENECDYASDMGELYVEIGEKKTKIRQKVVVLLSQLFEWRFHFHQLNPQLAYEVVVDPKTSQTLTDDGVPLFDTVIRYRDYFRGRELLLYNSALLMVFYLMRSWNIENGVVQAIHMLSTSTTFSVSSLEINQTCLILPHPNIKCSDVSNELIRSIEYFLQGTHRMNGAMNMILPFRILMDSLEYGSDERNFIRKVMDRMGVGQGFGFLQRIQKHMKVKGDLRLCNCGI